MVRMERMKKQIFRMDGYNCFMEVLNDTFHNQKVHFVFSNYNLESEKGDRITNTIDFYLSFGDALTLANLIISGELNRMLQVDRKNYQKAALEAEKTKTECKYFFGNPYWVLHRGTDAEKLAVKRSDGKAESRKLQIVPGFIKKERIAHPEKFRNEKAPNRFVIMCESGPGDKVNSRGTSGGYIIKPAYTQPEKKVMIPIPEVDKNNYKDTLMELALILKSHIDSYYQAGYTYEFINPAPQIISVGAKYDTIKVGDIVDIIIYTPSNVTRIDAMVNDREILPDETMEPIAKENGNLEWHFRKRSQKTGSTMFEFIPWVQNEKADFTKKCLVKVK